jgi:hypothetical protein
MLAGRTHRPRFTISLKRSTQNLQLSTSCPADYPIFRGKSRHCPIGSKTSILTHSDTFRPPISALRKAYSITSSARASHRNSL